MRFIAALVVGSLFTVAIPVARGESPEQKEFRSWGDWMTGGMWVAKDASGAIEEHVYRWTLGKTFVVMTSKTSPKEKSLLVVGIDPKSGQQTWWGFGSDGAVNATPAPAAVIATLNSGVKSEYSWKLANLNGPAEVKGITEKKGADQLWVDITTTVAGKATQDARMWNRQPLTGAPSNIVSPAPATIDPGLSRLALLAGKTTGQGNLPDGRKLIGAAVGIWVLGGKFFFYSGTAVDVDGIPTSYLLIAGIDPATHQPTGWEFGSDGAAGQYTLAADGKSLSGKSYLPDGKVLEFKGTFTTPAGTLLHYSATGVLDGKSVPYAFDWQRLAP